MWIEDVEEDLRNQSKNQSVGESWKGINYKGSQGQTERAVVRHREEEDKEE
jgi:hypothetical protein